MSNNAVLIAIALEILESNTINSDLSDHWFMIMHMLPPGLKLHNDNNQVPLR